MKIKRQSTRTLKTRPNGRSSDAVSPNYIYGCLGGCMKSYCYVGRYNSDKVYINENIEDINKSVNQWISKQPWPKLPNQVDYFLYTIDIGCSTDLALMQKFIDLRKILDFYVSHPKGKATFATKYPSMLNLSGEGQRVRISIMPEKMREILEPGTDSTNKRIDQYHRLVELNWETQLNFSPIVITDSWKEDYCNLFEKLKSAGVDTKCEVIFLTHSKEKHEHNSTFEHESYLWNPEIQEQKITQYGTEAIRYKLELKRKQILEFKQLYSEFWDPSNIRYIF